MDTRKNDFDAIIIGAGPAGLMAAIKSHSASSKLLVLEKMHRPCLKLNLTGNGRCNITNRADLKDFIAHFGKNGRFLKHAFSEFFNTDLIAFFETLGLNFIAEADGRFFPARNSAEEVSQALINTTHSLCIPLFLNAEVLDIKKMPDNTFAVTFSKYNHTETVIARFVMLATGGASYPHTGSNGAGYALASRLGHTITPILPSLVPIETKGNTAQKLEGLSLQNIRVQVWSGNKKINQMSGEMVFTGFGVSGPVILCLSKTIVELMKEKQQIIISLDLKPDIDHQSLDHLLLEEIRLHGNLNFKNFLKNLLPAKLIPVCIDQLHIPEHKKLHSISAEERQRLKILLKDFQLEVIGHKSFDHAMITAGGIATHDIDPQTMESKKIKGLYFAGEIIDIDADTGGFNLQAAFSTGWLAGRSIQERIIA